MCAGANLLELLAKDKKLNGFTADIFDTIDDCDYQRDIDFTVRLYNGRAAVIIAQNLASSYYSFDDKGEIKKVCNALRLDDVVTAIKKYEEDGPKNISDKYVLSEAEQADVISYWTVNAAKDLRNNPEVLAALCHTVNSCNDKQTATTVAKNLGMAARHLNASPAILSDIYKIVELFKDSSEKIRQVAELFGSAAYFFHDKPGLLFEMCLAAETYKLMPEKPDGFYRDKRSRDYTQA